MAKKSNHNLFRIIVSIIYMVLGGFGAISSIQALLAGFSWSAVLGLAGGLVMFVAGVLGFLNIKPKLCRFLGFIIFVIAAVSLVLTFMASGVAALKVFGTWLLILEAIVAWLFVIWMKNKK